MTRQIGKVEGNWVYCTSGVKMKMKKEVTGEKVEREER